MPTAASRALASTADAARGHRTRAALREYLSLTRPAIVALVVLTAPPAMVLGNGAWPEPAALALALSGIALVGAGSSALNAWWERERDARMPRTRERPLPAGRLAPARALSFGVASGAAGLGLLGLAGGWLPVALGAAALAHYLVVYTIWRKPRSAHNAVVGAVAGAAAPLIGDALDGRIGLWGVALFAIVFAWQPPHVWSIALYRRDEYAAAGFRMLPEVVGARGTRIRQLLWAGALVALSLFPAFAGALGPAYAAVALAGGVAFLAAIARALGSGAPADDRRVFHVSLAYLAVLFLAMTGELVAREVAIRPELLPHLGGALNATVTALLLLGLLAIRRGDRALHRRCMLSAVGAGVAFLALYAVQWALLGHRRLPGDDWVRALFLVILGTHTVLAIVVVPLVARALALSLRGRIAEHRRLVRVAYPVWLYVSVTGLVVYWMNNHLRPPG
jgi:protoheme IX farnesyltransferase